MCSLPRRLACWLLVVALAAVPAIGHDSEPNDRHDDDPVQRSVIKALGSIGRPAVAELRERLRSDNPELRLAAAEAFGLMSSDANAAVPDLIEALNDRDGRVRTAAVEAFGNFSLDGGDALPAIVQLASDPSPDVRSRAARALGVMGSSDSSVIDALLTQVDGTDASVQREAVIALGNLKASSEDVLASLEQRLRQVENCDEAEKANETYQGIISYQAAESLGRLGQAGADVLLEVGRSKGPAAEIAVSALGDPEVKANGVMELFAALLKEDDPETRRAAAIAIGNRGDATQPVVDALLELLKDQRQDLRDAALYALSYQQADLVEQLRGLARGEESALASSALAAAELAAGRSETAISVIESALTDTRPELRAQAVQSLDRLVTQFADSDSYGQRLEQAILIGLATDQPDVRAGLIDVAGKFAGAGSDQIQGQIEALSDDSNENVARAARKAIEDQDRFSVARVLADPTFYDLALVEQALLQPDAAAELSPQQVVELIEGEDDDLAVLVIDHLGANVEPEIVTALVDALNSDQSARAVAAREALVRIGETAVPELLVALKQKEQDRGRIAETLGRIGQSSETVVPLLAEILKTSSDPVERVRASDGLAGFGDESVPALLELIQSRPDEIATELSLDALAQIGPGSDQAVEVLIGLLDERVNKHRARE